MTGEKKLNTLLQNLNPQLNPGTFVFCQVPLDYDLGKENALAIFLEREGKTLVLQQETADSLQLPYDGVLSWITLEVHSSLEAVGLTAAVAAALTEKSISCNVIAAFYHDHLFIPKRDAAQALQTLLDLSSNDIS